MQRTRLRYSLGTFACYLVLSATLVAQDNPLTDIWPFNRDRAAASSKSTTTTKVRSTKSDRGPAVDFLSPTKMLDKAQQGTESIFRKTRESWKGVQNFGASLNPLASSRKKKGSFFDNFIPKPAPKESPATVGEFLKMKRPGF